jgi:hypothetical protein
VSARRLALGVLATVMRETVGALKEAKEIGWKVDTGRMVTSQSKFESTKIMGSPITIIFDEKNDNYCGTIKQWRYHL